MCGGDFLSKNPDEAMDFLNYVAETSKGWDELNPTEVERLKSKVNTRGGIYSLTEDVELKAKLSTLNINDGRTSAQKPAGGTGSD